MTTPLGKANLIGSERRYLRSLAHHLQPIVHIGKTGVTPGVLAEIDRALEHHELIKVRFLDFKEEKKALSQTIAAETHGEMVGLVGHIAIFYRQHPEPEKRCVSFPTPVN